jgi:PleD family two-component response regulator
MSGKCRLLVAVTPMGYVHARRALEGAFDLVPAFSLQQAVTALERSEIDAILCSIHFDDSRMFDLLDSSKAIAPALPFICCVMLDSRLSQGYRDNLVAAAKSNGARAFIDYNALQRAVGFPEADRRFREELLSLLDRDCGQHTTASSG